MKATDKPEENDAEPSDQADWTWADPKSLKVKADFQRLIPLQSKGELMALEGSIKEEGVRDPLLVWKGHNILLDGHTRRELAIQHEKQVKVQEIERPDEKAAVEYILRIQRERRNLTREGMSYFRGTEYNAIKKPRGGNQQAQKPKYQNDTSAKSADELGESKEASKQDTAKRLADKYGVSEITIKRDAAFAQVIEKLVTDYGDEEIRRKLLGADVRLTQGLARLLLKKTPSERKAAIKQLLEQGELPRAKKVSAAAKPKEVAKSLMTRLKVKGDDHARAVVQQLARMLGLEVVEKS